MNEEIRLNRAAAYQVGQHKGFCVGVIVGAVLGIILSILCVVAG